MAREIELNKVDIWNRATIADGNKLQKTTFGPLSDNDEILATCTEDYNAELQEHYSSEEYRKLTEEIPGHIVEWDSTSDTIKENSGAWTYFAADTDAYDAFATTTEEKSGAWNDLPELAASGYVASAWLSKNELPNSSASFVSGYHILRCGAQIGDQYKYYSGDVGYNSVSVAYGSAWVTDETTQKPKYNPTLNKTSNYNLSIIPVNNETVELSNNVSVSNKNAKIYSEYSLLNGQYGFCQHKSTKMEVVPVLHSGDYTHKTTNGSIVFAANGADDFTHCVVNSPAASVNCENSILRGGTCQDQFNSIGVSYHYQSSTTVDDVKVNVCSDVYGLYNSIANLKGRKYGISNSVALKGLVASIKGEGAEITQVTYHHDYDMGMNNSYAIQDNCFNCFPFSAVDNCYVTQSYVYPTKQGAANYGAASDSLLSFSYGSFDPGEYSPSNSYVNMLYFSYNVGIAPNLENCFYKERNANTTYSNMSNCLLNHHFTRVTAGDYDCSLLRFNDGVLSYDTMTNTVFNTCSSFDFAESVIVDNWINNLYNTSFGNVSASGNLILAASGSHLAGSYGGSECYNNILSLNTKSGISGNYQNSIVIADYEDSEKAYDGPCRFNSIAIEVGIPGENAIPGQDYESRNACGSIIINSGTTAAFNTHPGSNSTHFMVTTNSKFNYCSNILCFGDNISTSDKEELSYMKQVLFGNNIKLQSKTGITKQTHSDYFVFGNNVTLNSDTEKMKTVIIGNNFSYSNTRYKDLFSKLSPITQLVEPNDMFILCDDEGPFFIVTSNGYNTSKNYNGMYFYRDSKWYDVATANEVA